MRKFIIALLLFLGVLFILLRISEIQNVVGTLKRGDWRFVFLAILVILIWLVNTAASYWSIYRAIGLDEKVENLLPVVAAANFANIVAPTAGMSGMAIFVSEAQRRNYSPGRAAVAGALFVLFDYAAFFCVLAVGFSVLIRRNDLNIGEVIASGLLLGFAVVLAFLIYLGLRSAQALGKALAWLARLTNRVLWPFIHREYLSEKRAYEFAHDAAGGLKEIDRQPGNLILPLFLALSKQLLLIIILFLSFLAFKVPVSLGTLIASFSLGYLSLIVSPTPSGLGVVEGVLTVALISMYVDKGAAAVITLAYRGITFWFPLLIGLIAFRWFGHKPRIELQQENIESPHLEQDQ